MRRRNPSDGASTSARNMASAADRSGPVISVYRSSSASPPGAPLAISRAPAITSIRRARASSTRSRSATASSIVLAMSAKAPSRM